MSSRSEARAMLMRLATVADDAIDIGEAALALAALDRPERPLEPYRAHLGAIARDVRKLGDDTGDSMQGKIAALHAIIITRYGYAGDEEAYDDLRNANLMWVIDRRRGLPVALGIVYLHCALAAGWDMCGLNFPGHFLVRLEHEGQRAILDPFNGGRVLTAADLRETLKATAGLSAELQPGHYQPVSPREVLLRLQNNVKLRYIAQDDLPKALAVLERMRTFAPNEPSVWRETGLLEAHAGNLLSAIAALETFMHLSDSDRQRHQAALLIQELRSRAP